MPEPHNGIVLDLLFVLCAWHAYAKLRIHTTSTLRALKESTKALGQQLRLWVRRTCTFFNTRELPKEESARHRRKAAVAGKSTGRSGLDGGRNSRQGTTRGKGHKATNPRTTASGASKIPHTCNSTLQRLFNLCTYKIHALGHYVAAIAKFGSTDGYSTQIVCIRPVVQVDTILI